MCLISYMCMCVAGGRGYMHTYAGSCGGGGSRETQMQSPFPLLVITKNSSPFAHQSKRAPLVLSIFLSKLAGKMCSENLSS